MRIASVVAVVGATWLISWSAVGASSGARFYGDPPDETHPWGIHDPNRPQPPVVAPGSYSTPQQAGRPPSDAVILFDGRDLSNWETTKRGGGPAEWVVRDGYMEATETGGIRTLEKFGDCQLHIEWAAPRKVEGDGQGRGNSGIFLMGQLEIQVLDSYNNVTYADGGAGSMYGVTPPMANALRPSGEFQVCDIVFRRPIYREGECLDPGYVTMFMNGVLVHDHTVIEGPTGHRTRVQARPFPEVGPLMLQDHGNPVGFRNIWYRPLPPRAIEGGLDGPLTTGATKAQRSKIAAALREQARTHADLANPLPELLGLMESLEYASDDAAFKRVERLGAQYVEKLDELTAAQLALKKDEANSLNDAYKFMVKFGFLPNDFEPKQKLEQIIKSQGWDKRPRP